MVAFTGIRWRWHDNAFTTFEDAVSLLGEAKTYSASNVLKVWDHKGNMDLPVLYPHSEIKLRKRENERKKNPMDWRLVYGIGLSLRATLGIRGTDQRFQPMFCESNTLWQQPSESFWTDETFVSGYYLINFKLLFKDYKIKTQDLMVSELGPIFSALPPQILTETLFSIYMLSKERLLEKEVHSSPTVDSYGYHVKVGYNDSNGLSISSFDYRRKDNGIITHVRPHIPDHEEKSEETEGADPAT